MLSYFQADHACADTYANSALRGEAVCMAMGQVAGVAASMMKNGTDAADVPYQELCAALRTLGAIVPQTSESE